MLFRSRLVGMTLGEYDANIDDYSESWLLLIYFMSYMFLMTIIMLNILIAIVSDSYDSVMIRSKKLFLRAKFLIVADMMLMFPNRIQSKESRAVADPPGSAEFNPRQDFPHSLLSVIHPFVMKSLVIDIIFRINLTLLITSNNIFMLMIHNIFTTNVPAT